MGGIVERRRAMPAIEDQSKTETPGCRERTLSGELRAALAEAQQGEGDGPALKCPNPMITTVDRSKDGNCTVKAVKHPDGTFEVIKVEFQGNPCPTCHGEKP
jgi:hypothetical protein